MNWSNIEFHIHIARTAAQRAMKRKNCVDSSLISMRAHCQHCSGSFIVDSSVLRQHTTQKKPQQTDSMQHYT